MRIRSSKKIPHQIIVANLLNLGNWTLSVAMTPILLPPRLAIKDIQVLELSATLVALRKVGHCYHNNSSSHFRLVFFWLRGGTLEKLIYNALYK